MVSMTACRSKGARRQAGSAGKANAGCTLSRAYSTRKSAESDRFIHLPGTAEFDQELIPLVKAVHQDASSPNAGDFILEFYNNAGASLYRQRTSLSLAKNNQQATPIQPPPGLEAPPGLATPPQLQDTHDVEAPLVPSSRGTGYQVMITGLPKEICSVAMMEVVLEQAGLEEAIVGDIAVKKCQHNGEASVFLRSLHDAESCVNHFSGSCWSTTLDARIVKATLAPSAATQLSSHAPVFMPMDVSPKLKAASEFTPYSCGTSASWMKYTSDASTDAASESEGELSDQAISL